MKVNRFDQLRCERKALRDSGSVRGLRHLSRHPQACPAPHVRFSRAVGEDGLIAASVECDPLTARPRRRRPAHAIYFAVYEEAKAMLVDDTQVRSPPLTDRGTS